MFSNTLESLQLNFNHIPIDFHSVHKLGLNLNFCNEQDSSDFYGFYKVIQVKKNLTLKDENSQKYRKLPLSMPQLIFGKS